MFVLIYKNVVINTEDGLKWNLIFLNIIIFYFKICREAVFLAVWEPSMKELWVT
jgi:hypothetical protein